MSEEDFHFYSHPQTEALSNFLPILRPHLPFSNGLYNRMKAPHNVPSRHCLFAATFPAALSQTPDLTVPETYTIMFADRSRHSESQIWIFNPLMTELAPLTPVQQSILTTHLIAAILFLREIQIPDAPGWPFSPVLRFACLHEYFTSTIKSLAEPKGAFLRATYWNLWNIPTSGFLSTSKQRRPLPQGYTVGRVPEDQLDIVLSTSAIVRQPSTMLMLPNVGICNEAGKLIAWGYIGIDGSFATLYVLEEYRGKGLASYVSVELLGSYGKGAFADLGYDGTSGCVHSDVKAGNVESEGVMKSLGGKVGWVSCYVWVDCEKFQ